MYLICHMTQQDQIFKTSYNFKGVRSLRYTIILTSLVTIDLVILVCHVTSQNHEIKVVFDLIGSPQER